MKLEKKRIHFIPDANITSKAVSTLQKMALSRAQEGAKEKQSEVPWAVSQGEKIRESQT